MADNKHRRHSIDATAMQDMQNQARRVSFSEQDKIMAQPQNRRHSMMIMPQHRQGRRMSLDPRQQRRQSRRFSILPLNELEPTTFSGLPLYPKPVIKVENTFKLQPDQGTEFKAHIVRRETKEVMDRILKESDYMNETTRHKFTSGRRYNRNSTATTGGELATQLVSEVKYHLKTLKMERYKLVVNAFVGDCCGQGLAIASRSLWNTDTDGHVTVVHKTEKRYAVVVVHAAYYE